MRSLNTDDEIKCPTCNGESFQLNQYCSLCGGAEFMTYGYLVQVMGEERAAEIYMESITDLTALPLVQEGPNHVQCIKGG